MKRTSSETIDDSVLIACPECGEWEQQGIDDPRHHLNTLPIIEWRPCKEGQKEVSVHRCLECGEEFEVEWY